MKISPNMKIRPNWIGIAVFIVSLASWLTFGWLICSSCFTLPN